MGILFSLLMECEINKHEAQWLSSLEGNCQTKTFVLSKYWMHPSKYCTLSFLVHIPYLVAPFLECLLHCDQATTCFFLNRYTVSVCCRIMSWRRLPGDSLSSWPRRVLSVSLHVNLNIDYISCSKLLTSCIHVTLLGIWCLTVFLALLDSVTLWW